MKIKAFFSIVLILTLLLTVNFSYSEDSEEEILKRLNRELSQEEKFLERIIEELINKGDREFIEVLIYRMGYERAQEKLPRLFFVTQFGGGEMASGGVGVHIYNRQFYSYLTAGYTVYGKYKDYSVSFTNEVKMIDFYVYKRQHIDILLGAKISYYSQPGAFLSSVSTKFIYTMPDQFWAPYLVFNLFFDRELDKTQFNYQIGVGVNFYPWN